MNNAGLTIDSRVYDTLKWVALVLLPALASLYFGLGQIWNFPAVEQVVGSVTVVDTFLGLLLNKSSKNYQESIGSAGAVVGDIVALQKPDGEVTGYRMEAHKDPLILPADQKVVLEVRRERDPRVD